MSDLDERLRALEKEVASFQQALKSCHGLSDELDEANDRIEELEAERDGALFDYHEADKTHAEKAARIEALEEDRDLWRGAAAEERERVEALEALEAAGKRLAEAVEALQPSYIIPGFSGTLEHRALRAALAAWRAAEKGGGDE